MSTLLNNCPECGWPLAQSIIHWKTEKDAVCGTSVVSVQSVLDLCSARTIRRLKARVAELELMIDRQLRIWELTGGDVWCVARTEEECWGYLEDRHGNPDEITEMKEEGSGWTALPDDKKISLYVDSDGDVCGFDDGAPCNMPCWVWAVRHGAGFLGETE